jgi:hypothetical protein
MPLSSRRAHGKLPLRAEVDALHADILALRTALGVHPASERVH